MSVKAKFFSTDISKKTEFVLQIVNSNNSATTAKRTLSVVVAVVCGVNALADQRYTVFHTKSV